MKLSEYFSAAEIIRDSDVFVTFGPAAQRPGSVCYALDSATVEKANANACIAAIIVPPDLAPVAAGGKGCVISSNPRRAFYSLHNRLFESGSLAPHHENLIHPSAKIDPSSFVGRNVSIARGVTIAQGAIIEDYTILGEDTYVGPHCTIGARGLQNTQIDGRNFPVAFAGAVRIGARCEILAGAVIPKPYLTEFTEVGDDVKLGSRGSIGHSCIVGDSSIIGVASVVGGNSRIGRRVWIGPGVAIADGMTVGDDARILIGGVVIADVPAGATVSGNFALDHSRHLQHFTKLRHGR